MSPSSSRAILLLLVIGATSACAHHATPRLAEESEAPAVAKTRNVITTEAIANSAGQPIEKILADRVAGVRLGRTPDGLLTVQIRGATNLNSDAQPLYDIARAA